MAELLDKNRHFTCPNYKNIVVLIFKGEEIMWYWIIVALLVSGCAAMLFVSFSGIKQSKAELARAEGRGRKADRPAAGIQDLRQDQTVCGGSGQRKAGACES